jgi:Tfp pilus assembly protein PilV
MSGEQGFTLIETAIALVVMMVMALAVVSLFVFSINYNAGANDRAIALAIAQQRMERLRKARFSDASISTPSSTESYTSAGLPYQIVTTICSTSDCGGSAVSKVVTIQVTPSASSSQWASIPATIISKRSAPSVGPYLP